MSCIVNGKFLFTLVLVQRGLTPAAGYCSSLRTLLNHTAREPRRHYGSIVQFSALTGHTGGTGRTYQLDRCSPDMLAGIYTTGRTCRSVR